MLAEVKALDRVEALHPQGRSAQRRVRPLRCAQAPRSRVLEGVGRKLHRLHGCLSRKEVFRLSVAERLERNAVNDVGAVEAVHQERIESILRAESKPTGIRENAADLPTANEFRLPPARIQIFLMRSEWQFISPHH